MSQVQLFTAVACASMMFAACATTQSAPSKGPNDQTSRAPAPLAPTPPASMSPAPLSEGKPVRCPNNVPGVVVSSAPTKRGVAVVFAVGTVAGANEVRQRSRSLVEMYNAVYGSEAKRTSWTEYSETPDGARVAFSIFTPPDLDERIEPIPESHEDELALLRERINAYVVDWQSGATCPMMEALIEQGAAPPPG
jgi:hypothetical protein